MITFACILTIYLTSSTVETIEGTFRFVHLYQTQLRLYNVDLTNPLFAILGFPTHLNRGEPRPVPSAFGSGSTFDSSQLILYRPIYGEQRSVKKICFKVLGLGVIYL